MQLLITRNYDNDHKVGEAEMGALMMIIKYYYHGTERKILKQKKTKIVNDRLSPLDGSLIIHHY